MDSTFISFECEQQQQLLQETSLVAPQHFLDHTFENMSLHNESSNNHNNLLNNNGGMFQSDLLRDNKELSSRSRFISDDTMFGNINDIPDKSFDVDNNEVEESKDQKIICNKPANRILAPVELLGIPLLEVEGLASDAPIDDQQHHQQLSSERRIMLSPFAQKDSVV